MRDWLKKQFRLTPLQWAVHTGALLPLAWMAWDSLMGNLTVNPIQALTLRTGKTALVLLILSLAATPLNTVFKWRQAISVRRALGLYAFLYAAIHLLIFLGLDYGFDWVLLQGAIFEKRFVLAGLAAFLLLVPLAITSFGRWKKRLGKNWKRLHKLVYVAAPLVIVHYAWQTKGDVLRLQGDIWQPLAFGGLLALLLIARIPTIRRKLSQAGGEMIFRRKGPAPGSRLRKNEVE